jgi:hypothetical protein
MIGAADEVGTADPPCPYTDAANAQRIVSVAKMQCARATTNTDNEPRSGNRNPDRSSIRVRGPVNVAPRDTTFQGRRKPN